MKILNFLKRFHHESNLQRRFIVRVLAPPFLVLLCLGLLIFWQLDNIVRDQATSDLRRASTTTAAKIEREFALRQTILKRTGEELFVIKSEYRADLAELDTNRTACSAHVKQKKTFLGAPEGVCDPFLAAFASKGPTLQAIEDSYVTSGEAINQNQKQRINERLESFKKFFPETMALLVVDKKGQLLSSALSGLDSDSLKTLLPTAISAQKTPTDGKLVTIKDIRIGVFAYPIPEGSVLAAYDLSSESFIKDSWQSTPIDKSKGLAVITDSLGNIVYPELPLGNSIAESNLELRTNHYTDLYLRQVEHIAVAGEADASKWMVVVASPKAVVFGPVRDAQIIAVLIIGSLLVGFLWVGAFFIQRTVKNILGLVGGALIFASGKLDHKIELKNADQEFVQLGDTLNTMAGRIAAAEKDADEKNKEFISVATHELRTPLTAIIGNLSMVYEDMNDKLAPEVKPMIEQAFKGTNRLKDLINDMLDVARLEGGRAEFKILPIQIESVAGSVVDNLQITAQEHGLGLSYDKTNALGVLADDSRLTIVMNNFVSNALKYNRPNGTVKVSHSRQDGQLVTAIADTGLGIPEAQKAHMFEKFFRVDDADRKSVIGTGLGMYITQEYVIAMGGKVWFESTQGVGTTFFFSLPLAPSVDIAKVSPINMTVGEQNAAALVPVQPVFDMPSADVTASATAS